MARKEAVRLGKEKRNGKPTLWGSMARRGFVRRKGSEEGELVTIQGEGRWWLEQTSREHCVCVWRGGHLGKKEEWHVFREEGRKDEMGEMLQKM